MHKTAIKKGPMGWVGVGSDPVFSTAFFFSPTKSFLRVLLPVTYSSDALLACMRLRFAQSEPYSFLPGPEGSKGEGWIRMEAIT